MPDLPEFLSDARKREIQIDNQFDRHFLKTDLRGRSVRGGIVVFAFQVVRITLQLASTILMARLLEPNDFGLVAMVAAVFGVFSIFVDLGLSTATIQREKISHQQVSALFWINALIGAILTLLAAGLGPALAWFYSEPRLAAVSAALALSFFVTAIGVQHHALMAREMSFTKIGLVELVSVFVSLTSGILCALYGLGYWSLVLMALAGNCAGTIGAWAAIRWRPGGLVRGSGVRPMLVFGRDLAGTNITNYLAGNIDNVLIGRVWGANELGLYSRAYNLMLLPISLITWPIASVATPALSMLHGDPLHFRQYFLRALSCMAATGMLAGALLTVFCGEIVALILGPKWNGAIPIFFLLSLSIPFRMLMSSNNWLYVSTGNASLLLKVSIVKVTLTIVAICIGLPYGTKGVALAFSCFCLIWFIPDLLLATWKTPVTFADAFRTIFPPLISACIAAAVIAGIKARLTAGWSDLMILLFLSCILTLIYLVVLLVFFRQLDFYRSLVRSAIADPRFQFSLSKSK